MRDERSVPICGPIADAHDFAMPATIHASAMTEIEYLRQMARKCFRLARSINDPSAIAALETFGRELELRAAELERHADAKR
jgi:hypothetical protein